VADIAFQELQELMKQTTTIYSSKCPRLVSILEDEVSRNREVAVVLVTANEADLRLQEVETLAQVVGEVVAGAGDPVKGWKIKLPEAVYGIPKMEIRLAIHATILRHITTRPFPTALGFGHDLFICESGLFSAQHSMWGVDHATLNRSL